MNQRLTATGRARSGARHVFFTANDGNATRI